MAVMKDVAKLAGVSVSTVSFVLNGMAKEHKVADSTAQKVLRAAKQLEYKINSSVGNISEEKEWEPTIAFFIPAHSTWIDMSVVYAGINKHMKRTNRTYDVLLCPYEAGHLLEKINRVQISAYDSAVVSIESEKDLADLEKQNMSLPFVLYDHLSAKHSGVRCRADEAITQAVRMIAAKGYKRIRILSGNDGLEYGDEYLNLFIKTCEENKVKLLKEDFIVTENTMIGGAIAARSILKMEQKPEMIVCMSTSLAFGAIPLLARNHFLIPRDAELLCFGSSKDAEHIINYIPSLSMIARPIDEITIKAFDMALQLAEGKEAKQMHYQYSCDLLLHDSFTL
ncbi:LacI family DNA-binding transcriptional regulator [Konateibacter massiliensis]|uniref:LacI family DNA-binding transcriptional regulator n=1 Tax=Konateibacter massiliensis TaxID=2002841 RepID=UPI000C162798|nr:LacI family DNA-binding transcriptional regulator [Konateibacter massiliensis]